MCNKPSKLTQIDPVASVLKLRKTVITVIVTVIAATSYIFSIYPGSQQMSRTLFRQPQGITCIYHLLLGKHIRQRLEKIGRSALVGMLTPVGRIADILLEEPHLAPQVITLAPADEILNLLLPSVAICHIKHTSLQIGNHIGTEGEILVDSVLHNLRKISILLTQFICQGVCFRAFYQPRGSTEVLDIRLQLLSKLIVLGAIHRNSLADFSFGNRTEIDSAQRSVGQHF